MNSGIYVILNLENGKHYVGSAVNFDDRWSVHRHHLKKGTHHNPKLQCAWNKYGEDSFRFDRIEVVSNEELIQREQFWIDATTPFYNICRVAGSRLGAKLTEEQRRANSECQKQFWNSPEGVDARRRMTESKTGRVTSEETKAKLREHFAGKPLSDEHLAKISASLMGKKYRPKTEEERAAISQAMTGRKLSQETIDKMVASRAGFKHTDESIERMKMVKRKYVFTATNKEGEKFVFNDMKWFCQGRDLDYQSMYRVARGVQSEHRGWTVSRERL